MCLRGRATPPAEKKGTQDAVRSILQRWLGSDRSMRRPGLTIACALALSLAVVTLSPPSAAGDDVAVSQRNREFRPDRLAVKRGTVVHIVNDDKVTHHVFVDASAMHFDSGEQPVGKTVDLTFDRAGTFPVQCAIHPTMHLEVVVD
jgi:plastocyanin